MASLDTENYYLTEWHGMDNWQCAHCPFATLDGLAAILHHVEVHFPPPRKPAPSSIVIAAPGGKVIGRADEVYPAEPDEEE